MTLIQEDSPGDEETPLLGSEMGRYSKINLLAWRRDPKTAVKILVLFFAIFANFAGSTFMYPIFRMQQYIVCFEYAKRDGHLMNLPERYDAPLCLTDQVQVKLANLIAYKAFFNVFPMLLTTMFYGKLADTWGRRQVILLNMTGHVIYTYWVPVVYFLIVQLGLNIDSRIIWLDALAFLIGGGETVIYGALHAILSDVLDPEERFHYFSLFWALTILPDVIAPPVGAWQSDINIWLPFYFGAPYFVVITIAIMLMPDTLKMKRLSSQRSDHLSPHEALEEDRHAIDATSKNHQPISKGFYRSIFSTRAWILLLTIMFLWMSLNIAVNHFKQYCITFLGWTLQGTAFLTSAMAFSSFVNIGVILPLGDRLLRARTNMSTQTANLTLASLCLIILAISGMIRAYFTDPGWFIIGSLLFPTGQAVFPALKALGAPLYAETLHSQFYAMTGIFQQLAGLAADPAAAAIFSKSLEARDNWPLGIGAVFWVSGAVALASAIFLLLGYSSGCYDRPRHSSTPTPTRRQTPTPISKNNSTHDDEESQQLLHTTQLDDDDDGH